MEGWGASGSWAVRVRSVPARRSRGMRMKMRRRYSVGITLHDFRVRRDGVAMELAGEKRELWPG
jgi:hypothetical protein